MANNKPETGRTVIQGATVITEEAVLEDGVVCFQGERIEFVGTREEFAQSPFASGSATVIEAAGGYVVPGFIDLHVHGGHGSDFMDAEASAYDNITVHHASNGTTTILATTVTASRESINRVLEAAWTYRNGPMPGAKLGGVHLEGPFISPKWPGAQNPAYIMPPRRDWLEAWEAQYPGLIRVVTLAPEREGALELIGWLADHGIVASAGHTDATYDEITAAADHGLTHAVHTFNAMKGLHHREPGTVGAVMTDSRIQAEVIADGHHVHHSCIRLLAQAKGPDGLVLVTDSMSACGLPAGDYKLGELDVVVDGGVARLKEGGALAGSTLTMLGAFRHAVTAAGMSLRDASKAASGNPARELGIYQETGSIAPGKQADLLWLDRDLALSGVWVNGRRLERLV
jgi:N-acetylglucosamine-6-phosphate deacetylase